MNKNKLFSLFLEKKYSKMFGGFKNNAYLCNIKVNLIV